MVKEKTAKQKLNNIFLIYGDEDYLKKRACNLIVRKTVTAFPEFNYKKYDGLPDIDNLIASVTSIPMMAEKKCVVVRDADTGDFDADQWKKFLEIIKNVPPECVLVLYYDALKPNPKKEKRFETLLKNVDKLGDVRNITSANKVNAEINTFVMKIVKANDCTIDNSTINYLFEACGGKMLNIETELKKICSFAGSGNITKEQIDAVATKPMTDSAFDMANCVIKGNVDKAIDILNDLFLKKEPSIAILYALSSNFCDMIRAKAAYQSGKNSEAVTKDFGYYGVDFKVRKAFENSRYVDVRFLEKALEILMKADKELKSTPIDDKVILDKTILDIERARKEMSRKKYGSH